MRTQTTRTVAGRVNADGTPATGSGYTSRKTGTGAYTVTITDGRILTAVVGTAQVGGGAGGISSSSYIDRTFNVATFSTNTLAAVDSAFAFTAVVAA